MLRIFFLLLALTACSPKFDWRDVRSKAAPFSVLMPGKPSELSREIQLGQQRVTMHMTATRIDEVTFAVGAVKMQDKTQAQTTMELVKNALLANLGGSVTSETSSVTNVANKQIFITQFDARGKSSQSAPIRMVGRVVAQDVWVYEVLVVGPEKTIDLEVADTFVSSFKP